MKILRFTLSILLFIIYFPLYGQIFMSCDVYQFINNESTKQKIVLTQTFNKQGKIIQETYNGFKDSTYGGYADGIYTYLYKDTILVLKTFISHDVVDNDRTIYYYNKQDKLLRQEHFTFQRKLKKNVDKVIEHSDECIIDDDDYEKYKVWVKTSIADFTYDKKGNKILYDATKLHYNSENKYTWTYDSLNRVVKHACYEKNRLIWTETFVYFEGGYEYQSISEGSKVIPDKVTTIYLNKDGKVSKEITKTKNGKLICSIFYFYNSEGQISRRVYCDSDENPTVTHIYKYHFIKK